LQTDIPDEQAQLLRRHERTGRPLGSEPFLRRLERRLACVLQRQKTRPKPQSKQPVR
jgi:putative transposase